MGYSIDPQGVRFLETIDQLIDLHLGDHRYAISDLADDLGISRVQLHRKIKKLTGKSASEHIRDKKLEAARHLLLHSGHSVTAIAYEVGFNNLSYFARKFREKYQCNPSALQNSAKS